MYVGAGYKAILLTVDCVALGYRINEFRNSFTLPVDIEWPNIESKGKASATATDDTSASYGTSPSERASWAGKRLIPKKDTELNWDNVIPWLREHTKLPIWLKGGECCARSYGKTADLCRR